MSVNSNRVPLQSLLFSSEDGDCGYTTLLGYFLRHFKMDVPFISSGAMSRAHYALVRRVETAPSSSTSDQLLLAELQGIHRRLTHSALTLVSTFKYRSSLSISLF